MTIMEKAMNEAGITVPVNKRIWMWLKDHPKKSISEMSAVFDRTPATIASYIGDMEERGMLVRSHEKRRMKGGGRGSTGHIIERDVSVYEVSPKMRGEFELWPKPKKAAPPVLIAPVLNTPMPVAPPAPKVDKVSAPAKFSAEKHCDGLTLSQCKAVYRYLADTFEKE